MTILREPVEIFIFSPGCAHFYPVPEKLNVAMKSLNYASAGSADTGSWGMAEIFTIQFDEIAWSLEENMWVLFS